MSAKHHNRSQICAADFRNWLDVLPPDVLCQSLFAGMEFVAEGTFVLLLWNGSVASVPLLVNSQVGLGGVALEADVTLERLLPSMDSGVTLIFP